MQYKHTTKTQQICKALLIVTARTTHTLAFFLFGSFSILGNAKKEKER